MMGWRVAGRATGEVKSDKDRRRRRSPDDGLEARQE